VGLKIAEDLPGSICSSTYKICKSLGMNGLDGDPDLSECMYYLCAI
jgi:hypothetical protein